MYNFGGIKIIPNSLLVEYEPATKTWVDIILLWNPCNPWKKPDAEVPSKQVYMDKINNVIYAHPMMVNKIRRSFQVPNRML